MRIRTMGLLVAAAGLLAGCDSEPSASPTTTAATSPAASTTTAVTTTTAGEAPPTTNTPASVPPGADAKVTVTGIRIGHHDGFDRVVYDLSAPAAGWHVRYVDQAIQQGSGKQVDVAGRSILAVDVLGAGYPFDTGATEYAGPNPLTDPSTPGITGVHFGPTFEGTTQSFIGLTADRPAFRASSLAGPDRLVVDIATG